MKKQFVNPAVRVIKYESNSMICDQSIPVVMPAVCNTGDDLAPARGAFDEENSLF